MLAFHQSPWQTSEDEEDRVESEEEEKMCCREEDRKRQRRRGRKQPVIHSNTSSTRFSSAQPGKQYVLRPPPEGGLCNQSFLSVRQLVVHTGSQLGWKEEERQARGGRDSLAFAVTVERENIISGPKLQ